MPFCFTTQLQQRAVATELAALRRLAKSRKPPAKKRNLHGSASLSEESKAADPSSKRQREGRSAIMAPTCVAIYCILSR